VGEGSPLSSPDHVNPKPNLDESDPDSNPNLNPNFKPTLNFTSTNSSSTSNSSANDKNKTDKTDLLLIVKLLTDLLLSNLCRDEREHDIKPNPNTTKIETIPNTEIETKIETKTNEANEAAYEAAHAYEALGIALGVLERNGWVVGDVAEGKNPDLEDVKDVKREEDVKDGKEGWYHEARRIYQDWVGSKSKSRSKLSMNVGEKDVRSKVSLLSPFFRSRSSFVFEVYPLREKKGKTDGSQ